jgi:hypothetical protein
VPITVGVCNFCKGLKQVFPCPAICTHYEALAPMCRCRTCAGEQSVG